MPYKDPKKQKEYQREWASQNKQLKSKQTGWLKRKAMVEAAKDKPCAACNQSYPSVCMDFHHTDPTVKDGSVSKLMKSSSYQKLQEEIDKCVVLCSNCHRLLHAGLIPVK
jgi:hypothetical protein